MRTEQSIANTPAPLPEWRMLMAGLCASLVGIGLARFAYTPLLPAIINAQWFSASTAAYLGAANLAGYLAGALLGVGIARQTGTRAALRLMMVLATLAFFACALPVSFIWFFLWRFVSASPVALDGACRHIHPAVRAALASRAGQWCNIYRGGTGRGRIGHAGADAAATGFDANMAGSGGVVFIVDAFGLVQLAIGAAGNNSNNIYVSTCSGFD